MGFASHLGPWLLGTVKNTTGTTSGTVRNMGATVVTQSVALVPSVAVTIMLPAGAMVHAIQSLMTTGAAGTPNVTIGSVVVGTLSTAAGFNSLVATAGNVGTLANIGDNDALVSYTATAASAGTLVVTYTVRDSDGSANPSAQQQ